MNLKTLGIAGFAVAMVAVPALQWTNPHSWIMLTVAKDGMDQQGAIEVGGPAGIARQGWRPKTLRWVVLHPPAASTLTLRP
jgi:hypothetical protein